LTVKKRYAESKTAYHRVLADPSVSQDRKDNLTDIYYSINPVILKNGMIALKKDFERPTKGNCFYSSSLKGGNSL